jgi:annexin A7/11
MGILSLRSKEHLARIDTTYESKFGKTLTEELSSSCSGAIGKLFQYLLMPNHVLKAKFIHDATAGMGTDETMLVQTLVTCTPEEIEEIETFYEPKYGKTLREVVAEELASTLTSSYKKLGLMLVERVRDHSDTVDEDLAVEQAERLYQAGEKKMFGRDANAFIEVLGKANFAQIRMISDKYDEAHNKSLRKAIKKCFSGKFAKLICYLCEPPSYQYTRMLNEAFAGLGCNDDLVARVLGCVSKEEAFVFNQIYEECYPDDKLSDRMASELGGNFKKMCLGWIGYGGKVVSEIQ